MLVYFTIALAVLALVAAIIVIALFIWNKWKQKQKLLLTLEKQDDTVKRTPQTSFDIEMSLAQT